MVFFVINKLIEVDLIFFIFLRNNEKNIFISLEAKKKTWNHGYLYIFRLVFFIITRLEQGQHCLLVILILIKKYYGACKSCIREWAMLVLFRQHVQCCLMSKHFLLRRYWKQLIVFFLPVPCMCLEEKWLSFSGFFSPLPSFLLFLHLAKK